MFKVKELKMSLGSLGDLRYNFQEIYQATHLEPTALGTKSLEPVELYENLSPDLLLAEGQIHCRPCFNVFLNNDLTRDYFLGAIQKALEHTHNLFHEYQTRLLSTDMPRMLDYMRAVCKLKSGQGLDECAYQEVRENIQDFWIATHFFLKSVHADPNVRMQKIFKKHFCRRCFDHMESLEQVQSILALQGFLGETLPLRDLVEASFGNEGVDESLIAFVKKVKAAGVPFDVLHLALKSIVEYASKYKMTQDDILRENYPALDKLELALDEIDPAFLMDANPDHLAWRDTLKPGSEIISVQYENHSGRKAAVRYRFILGEQIGAKPEGFDHNLYFSLKECYVARRYLTEGRSREMRYEPLLRFHKQPEERLPEKEQSRVLWISINEAMPGLRHIKSKIYYERYLCEYGFANSCIDFIDNSGRFALVEKLQDNQKGLLKVIPEMIKIALQEVAGAPVTLEPLNKPQKFMFDANKCLKATKLIKPAKAYSFSAWEQFVYDVAKGDKAAFAAIMAKSGLDKTEEVEFLRQAVQDSFREDKGKLEQASYYRTFHDKQVFALATSLQNDLAKIFENCCRSLETASSQPVSKEKVKRLLLEYCRNSSFVSFLSPSLQSDVVRAYTVG